MKKIATILFLFCSIVTALSQEVRIVEKQPNRVRLHVMTDVPAIGEIIVDGQPRAQVLSDLPLFQHKDGYVLPYKPVLIHLNSRQATVSLVSSQEQRFPINEPMPMSESFWHPEGDDQPKMVHDFLAPVEPNLVEIDYLGQFKQSDLLRVAVYPFRYDRQTGELIVTTQIIFDVFAETHNMAVQPATTTDMALLDNMDVIAATTAQKARPAAGLSKKTAEIERWRIVVNEDGLYRITGHDLAAAGVRLLDIDFKQLRLTSDGKEVSVYAEGWRDGQFNADDYFEFWGTARVQTFQDQAPDLYQDPYGNHRVYWLSWEKRGLWMVEESGEISDTQPGETIRPYSYMETLHFERDNYFDHLSKIPMDTLRDHWFWDRGILAGKKVDYPFDLWHPDNQSPLRVTARVMLSGLTTATDSAHSAIVYLNNTFIASHDWYSQDYADLRSGANSYINGADVKHGENILSVVNGVNPQRIDNFYLNWFEVNYPRLYRAQNDFIKFRIPPDLNNGKFLFRVDGFVDPDIDIYKLYQSKIVGGLVEEVTDFHDFTSLQISFQNDVLYPETEFVAVSNSAKLKPLAIQQDRASHLKDNQLAADYVIIAHEKFYDTPILDDLLAHRQSQGYHALKVDVQDIYDEFSHGHMSPYAIRDFLKWAYDQWQEPRLRHVLLVGDGCYLHVTAQGDTLNYIPVYLRQTLHYGAAASDFWYTLISGNDEVPDINIGRFPVKTVAELDAVVSKMLKYETAPPTGDWPNRFLIIGGNGLTFRTQGLALSRIVPQNFDTRTLFSLKDKTLDFDPYFGGTTDLLDYLGLGCSVVTFHGHGGGAIWADNNLLRLEDVSRFYTRGKLPFILSMTCYTGRFEEPHYEQSLADALLFAEGEGALAMVGASGVGWEWNDYFLQTEIMKMIFNNPGQPLGDMFTAGKISYLAHYKTTQAISQINQYHLLGDPATRIVLPEHQTTLDVANPILLKGDTVNVVASLPFVQGQGHFHVQDSIKVINSESSVAFSDGRPTARLPIDEDFIGQTGTLRFYGTDDFGNNRTHGSVSVSLKGAIFDSAYAAPTAIDTLYEIFVHVRSRAPLQKIWCLALNDSLSLEAMGDNWFKSEKTLSVPFTGFQFSYYFQALDENNTLHTSQLFKHYINFAVDVALDQENLRFVGLDQVFLETMINNASSNAVDRLPILYEYQNENGWKTIGYDTVDIDAYASIRSRYAYAPAPGPLHVRITLDPDSTLREQDRDDNVLSKMMQPNIFQCTSTGFVLNGERSTTLAFDENVSIELPVGALSGNSALFIDTLNNVTIFQQPDYAYVSGTPAYDLRLLSSTVQVDKAVTLVLHMAPDSAAVDSVELNSTLFRFSRQTKKWIKCQTQNEPGRLYAELPDIGPVAVLAAQDLTPPDISLAIDGQPYVTGKWASAEPRIGIRLQDMNGVDISSGRLEITLNGKTVDAADIALPDSIIDGNQILISYNPQLLPGDQTLTVQAADCNQNITPRYEFSFRVAGQFEIQMLGNYPNPFTDDTRFVYLFTSPVTDMSLKIFTASGRLIRHFDATTVFDDPNPLSADYHEVYWDGRDADGYEVANGVYFYQLIGKADGRTKTITGKIAKIK